MGFDERVERVLRVLLEWDGFALAASEISQLAGLIPGTIRPVQVWLEGERQVDSHWTEVDGRHFRVFQLAQRCG